MSTKTAAENAVKEVGSEGMAEKKTVMYMGPTFKGAAYGSVYTNGLPKPLEDQIEEAPVFAELVVPVENLEERRKEKSDPESAYSKCFRRAAEILKEVTQA